jgi:hypothetical protein
MKRFLLRRRYRPCGLQSSLSITTMQWHMPAEFTVPAMPRT